MPLLSLARRLATCLACVLLAGAAFAQRAAPEPLTAIPLAPALRQPGELQALMRAAMQDYERLPRLAGLAWYEGSAFRTWSPARAALGPHCPLAQDGLCAELMKAQALELARVLADTNPAAATEMTAAAWSALADTCASVVAFEACSLSHRLPNAALQWLVVGNDSLFAAYLAQYLARRDEYLAWLRGQGQQPSASTLAELPELPAWINARYHEVTGALADARFAWVAAQGEAQQRKDTGWQRESTYQLARLSWRLGDAEAAQGWQSLLETLPGHVEDVARRSCQERHEQWRIDIARAAAEGTALAAPLATLQGLMAAGCPYSRGVLEYATDVLVGTPAPEQLETVRAMLALAAPACAQACPPLRTQALATLQRLLTADAAGRDALAAEEGAALARTSAGAASGQPTDDARRLSWAIGATLMRDPATRAAGAAVVLALQGQLLNAADYDPYASAQAQQNRSRFEPLYRLGAVAALVRGTPLDLRQLEAMRAQTLLRRLRLEGQAAELANVRDPEAEQRYAAQMAELGEARAKVEAATASQAGAAWVRTSMLGMFDAAAEVFRIGLLEARAARLLDGGDPQKAWRRSLVARSALGELEMRRSAFGRVDPITSLAPEEAYLSWLQVPGGYLAATATYDPEFHLPWDGTARVGGHRRHDRFIPLSPAQEASLRLYRELLLAGTGSNRGARRVDAGGADTGGLRLRGLPVWRTAEGHFVAQAEAPAGAQRARSLRELGAEVHGWLLEPLRARWAGARRLVISPDGVLAQVPFETLVAGDRLLVDQLEISYVQSLQVHAELKRRAAARADAAARLLSVAAPDYGAAPPAAAPSWMTAVQWQPLPGTAREAQALRQLYPQADVLAGPQAARARLLALDAGGQLQSYALLHFATHGYVDDQRSALVLSTREGLQQAYLTDQDISALRLRSDLVLLSACDTGLGRRQSGEGVVGLPYAFMLAGNVNTVMSLWPVDDEGTAQFMPAFLAKARAGQDLVAALNATKREFAAGALGERNRDPRIWAAFVQYGVPLRLP